MGVSRLGTFRKPNQCKRERWGGGEYLKEEKQSVVVSEEFSQGMEVSSGVPQRSVLRGMLINIFINSVEKETSMK